jgi:uncharacterized membrane protein YidH (DUF202 family)
MTRNNNDYDLWIYSFIGLVLTAIGLVQLLGIYPIFETLARISYEMTIKSSKILGGILLSVGAFLIIISMAIIILSWKKNRKGNGNREGNNPAN